MCFTMTAHVCWARCLLLAIHVLAYACRLSDNGCVPSRFADVLLKHYRPGDVVWVQDYHLMMLPELLKKHQPHMKVQHILCCFLCLPPAAVTHGGLWLGMPPVACTPAHLAGNEGLAAEADPRAW